MTGRIVVEPTHALGIDQGEVSGWGLKRIADRAVLGSGIARKATDRRYVIAFALDACEGDVRRLLVMLEDHTKMPLTRLTRADANSVRRPGSRRRQAQRSTGSIIGQGDSRGRWRERLEDLDHPAILRDMVEPKVWRLRVLGVGGSGEERLKRAALSWACRRTGELITNHNQAEGLAIAEFAAVDGVARLAYRRRKASAKRRQPVQAVLSLDDTYDAIDEGDEDDEGAA